MIIGIDFDGTIVTHDYPHIGKDIGAFPVLKALKEKRHKLILYTMRSEDKLQEAISYCQEKGLEFDFINENPEQQKWTKSPKIFCNFYIDDAAIGVPLKNIPEMSKRPYVDWDLILGHLKSNDIL